MQLLRHGAYTAVMFAHGMPRPAPDSPRTGAIFCASCLPGCREMIVVSNLGNALAAGKIVVAGQVWRFGDGRWQCDRCAAGWYTMRP